MKTITLSDEDHKALMEFSKELQIQPNHSQAFPYFWEPASEKLVENADNEGDVAQVIDYEDGETYTIERYAEINPGKWKEFIHTEEYEELEYDSDLEAAWFDFLDFNCEGIGVFSSDWKQSSDHNPSLFLSDVKGYIEANSHHLGRNPRTYARTVHRMPKMASLIEIIYRLNPQPSDDINDEARRFVLKK